MLIQAGGSGIVGTAVTRGASYTAIYRTLAVAVGSLVIALFVLYRAGRLPAGGTVSQ